jgi:hypothetical protein
MCGGGSAPKDRSPEVEQIRVDASREQQQREDARRQQEREEFEQGLANAYSAAVGDARGFFQTQGLDPSQFESSIQQKANTARAMVPQGTQDFSSFFDNLGQRVYDKETEGTRNKALRDVQSFTPEGFYRSLIGDDALQDIQQGVLGEQKQQARGYADNLLARGMFTDRGHQAAIDDLVGQKPRANRQLSEIATALLESGRGDLRDIATRGKQSASNISLGQNFDPFSYEQQINDATRRFFEGLGENFRSYVPENLFDTSNLAVVGGKAQGAQNTPFDPAALAGIFGGTDEEEEKKKPATAML